MNHDELISEYTSRYEKYLLPISERLSKHLRDFIGDTPHIDDIRVRAKRIESFLKKAGKKINSVMKYSDPINQIFDQIGARVVVYYLSDIEIISKLILDYYSPVEMQQIIPDSPDRFGYEGVHYLLFLPEDILTKEIDRVHCPQYFELQVHTLFQHAWGEANHDIAYKAKRILSLEQKRKISFTAAQAWGADMIFDQLFSEIIKSN